MTTFILVALVSVFLWKREKPFCQGVALFLLFVALMQLVEALLWFFLPCTSINRNLSRIIPFLLYSQPIVLLSVTLFFHMGRLPSTFYFSLLALWIFCAPLWLEWLTPGWTKCTTQHPHGHLAWPYANTMPIPSIQTLYHMILSITILSWNTPWYGIFYVALSALSYIYVKQHYGHSWGSVWCHGVNVLAIAALWL